MPDCGGPAEFDLGQQTVSGYRTREDAQAAAQDHIRAVVSGKSPDLCKGKCADKTTRCKAIILDEDLAGAVRTFMHRDDDGDPSFGWLIGGAITIHCACVEKRRPNKPVSAATPAAAVTPPAAPTKPTRKRPARRQPHT